MKLFSTKDNHLKELNEKKFHLESEIQSITENNMQDIFNLELVKSEFSLNNFRLDSLCFDKETNSFVIIEYKRSKNFSVIDQGYSYLSLMINNKSDFILEYNERMNTSIRRDDVDWSQSRVIFISPQYTVYQRESINFKDLPIELWEIKQFENDTLMYLPIKPTKTSESIQTISSEETTITKVSKEVKTYNEKEHFDGKSSIVFELYNILKNEILELGDITIKPTKQHIGFVGKRNIVDVVILKSKIKVFINLKFNELEDYKNIVRDVTKIGHWGNGDCEIIYKDVEEVEYLLSLIKQSFAKNGS